MPFNMYINDLFEGLSVIPIEELNIPGFLFANDAVILVESS